MPQDSPEPKSRKKMIVEEVKESLDEIAEATTEAKEKINSLEAPPVDQEQEITPQIANEPELSVSPEPLPQSIASGPSPLVIIIPGIFLLGGLLGGILYYQNKISITSQPTQTPSVSESLEPSPTVTNEPKEVDKEKYEITIQNGSGIGGEAGRAQAILEKDGFKVSGTANADNYNYTKTVIKAKSTVDKDYLANLSEALGKVYEVDSKTQTFSSSSSSEVIVIVGSSKK